MIETIIILCLVLATKRKTPRRRSNLSVQRVSGIKLLATLADSALIGGDINAEQADRPYWIISADLIWSLRNHTAGEGPIHVGLAHPDYSDAEIEEWFENSGSLQKGDLVSQEKARRRIRQVGSFSGKDTEEHLNDGKPIRTKCMWGIIAGQTTAKLWAYNQSAAALTTGSSVLATGKVYARPA